VDNFQTYAVFDGREMVLKSYTEKTKKFIDRREAFLTIMLSLLSFLCMAQKDSITLLRSYNGDISTVAIDNLDNLYIVSSSGSK
jgi:hypothetical protein